MTNWFIEWYANEALTQLFWIITGATVPFWLLMIFRPGRPSTRRLCHPLLAPTLMSTGLAYLYWQLWEIGLPSAPENFGFSASASVATHPIVLLILWLKIQTLNLFLGETLYAEAAKAKRRIPIELVVCWLLGPIGLLAYAVRVAVTRLFRR